MRRVPSILTSAPSTGLPEVSVTVPVTVVAKTGALSNPAIVMLSNERIFIIFLY